VALATPRATALTAAIGVTAAQLFAAQGTVPGAIALGCFALAAASAALERRAHEWLVAALAAHVVLGMAGGLYERSVLYDKVVHLAASFGLARWIAAHFAERVPRSLVMLAALGLGALFELFEFAADTTGLVVAQRGLADTMLDLAADAAGAALGGCSAWRSPGSASGSPSSLASPQVPHAPT
jgi:hypothetical protein